MSEHHAQVEWRRQPTEAFTDQRYSRLHTLRFDGGTELIASASPSAVALPYSNASAVDPEELFVASLSSCHMLWFLSLAAAAGWRVESYLDDAVGTMGRDERGHPFLTTVTLRPRVRLADGSAPEAARLAVLHHRAHEACFIANSVKSEVRVEPRP
ncbi:peroxiredoxin [Rubrivivax gelatinosus]|uniref:Peroxiredoxin n=1 Tax=Rubrivivax gelatinosus TaxID=28068 RepID=A0ABS1DX96_RUBGE|nr:OsmC family protein [Rubrivivax gelatinosus]MBK1613454.1 peroxiredoxin [Rubrivivax gelatinosus]MBK1713974.1 peroxiredoxin [Rubrivivax gelatinosus]